MNVNEIINIIRYTASQQRGVHSVYDGDVYENWNAAETKYGSVNIGLQNVSYDDNLVTYTVVLYYGDRLIQDKKNVNSIYSDGIRVLQSIINTLNQMDGVDIEGTIIYTPFEQKFMDYLAGQYTTVDIICESELGLCNIDNYEYVSDKDKLIQQLIEKIQEYREEDAELSLLLKQILFKLVGTTEIDEHEYMVDLLVSDINSVVLPNELSVSTNGANFDENKGCKPSSDGKYLQLELDSAYQGIKNVKLHLSFDSKDVQSFCEVEQYNNGTYTQVERVYNEGATKNEQVFTLHNIDGNAIRIKRNGTIVFINKIEVIYK